MDTLKVSHIDGARRADELVLYRTEKNTNTNDYGTEMVVRGDRVVRIGGNNNEIPADGFVLSGNGTAAEALAECACEGALVRFDEANMTVTVEMDVQTLKTMETVLTGRLSERIAKDAAFPKTRAEALLRELRDRIETHRIDGAKKLLETLYYLTADSVKGEIRAVWHRPKEHSDAEAEATILRFKNAGFNRMMIEIDYHGFSNALKLKHDYLLPEPEYADGFDAVEALVKAGKKYGVEIHAWFENFYCGAALFPCAMKEKHPEWLARTRSGGWLHDDLDIFYYLNPAIKEVRELLLNHIKELLDNYDFDGLQLDYIRYPIMKDLDRCAGFDEYSKREFKKSTGIDADSITDIHSPEMKAFTEWRASFITEYVREVRELIDGYRKNGRTIELSTAVFGDPDEAIRIKCQDWRTWVKNGWLDAIYPMAYFCDAEAVGKEVANMVTRYGKTPNVSGLSTMYDKCPLIEATRQVEACRKAGAAGVAFFASGGCTDEHLEALRIGVFREM